MAYGLVFDMDGVLADTERLNVEATNAMFKELYGVEPEDSIYEPYVGRGAKRYVEGPAEKLGIAIDTEKALQRRLELFSEILESRGETIAFPGVLQLISAAAASPDWKLAIATASPREKANATLKAAQIPLKFFSAYINGDMVEKKKPDPEIYEVAAKSLGLLPGQCVGIEDAPPGVQALRAAGMKSIAVTHTFPEKALVKANIIVPAIKDITLDMLKSLMS